MDLTNKKVKKMQIKGELSGLKVYEDDSDIVSGVPLDINNSDYAEIMRQVDAGELTIEAAEEVTPEPVDE